MAEKNPPVEPYLITNPAVVLERLKAADIRGAISPMQVDALIRTCKSATSLIEQQNRQIARLRLTLSYIAVTYADSHLSPLGRLCECISYDLPQSGDEKFDAAFAHLAPSIDSREHNEIPERAR
jgi:hypothetical protein